MNNNGLKTKRYNKAFIFITILIGVVLNVGFHTRYNVHLDKECIEPPSSKINEHNTIIQYMPCQPVLRCIYHLYQNGVLINKVSGNYLNKCPKDNSKEPGYKSVLFSNKCVENCNNNEH